MTIMRGNRVVSNVYYGAPVELTGTYVPVGSYNATDLNTIFEVGEYRITEAINGPETYNYGVLKVFTMLSEGKAFQEFRPYGSQRIYTRYCTSGTWGSWANVKDAMSVNGKTASSTPLTTEKSDLVGMVNEVFTNANNCKSIIATAIGEPLTASDTSSQMGGKIDTINQNFRDILSSKKIAVSPSDKTNALVNKLSPLKMYSSGIVLEKGVDYDERRGVLHWNKTIADNRVVKFDSQGNIIVGVWGGLIKYDKYGNQIWTTGGMDNLNQIEVDSDDTVYHVGNSWRAIDCFNSNGTQRWQKQYTELGASSQRVIAKGYDAVYYCAYGGNRNTAKLNKTTGDIIWSNSWAYSLTKMCVTVDNYLILVPSETNYSIEVVSASTGLKDSTRTMNARNYIPLINLSVLCRIGGYIYTVVGTTVKKHNGSSPYDVITTYTAPATVTDICEIDSNTIGLVCNSGNQLKIISKELTGGIIYETFSGTGAKSASFFNGKAVCLSDTNMLSSIYMDTVCVVK